MKDEEKTKKQLINELSKMRLQVAELEKLEIERKHIERELQRSNDLLRAIIEAAPTAITALDLDGNVQMVWNPAAEKMLGWSAQEAMGRPLPSVPVESQEEFRCFRDRIRTGNTLDGVEVCRQRRDGTPIDYSIYASPLHDSEGRITGNVAVLVDITERKRAEESLRQSEEQLRRIMNNMVDLVIQLDACAVLQYISPSVGRLMGYRMEEVLGKLAFDFIHPDDRESAISAFMEVMKTGYGIVEVRIQHCDGHYVWMELRANALAGDYGEKIGIIVGCRDTTERRQAEVRTTKLSALKEQLLGRDALNEKLRIITETAIRIYDADFARIWITRAGDLCEKGC